MPSEIPDLVTINEPSDASASTSAATSASGRPVTAATTSMGMGPVMEAIARMSAANSVLSMSIPLLVVPYVVLTSRRALGVLTRERPTMPDSVPR